MTIREKFEIPKRYSLWSYALIAVGIISVILLYVTHGDVHCIIITWRFKLYRNYFKYAYKRNEYDKNATNNVGYSFHGDPWCTFFPCSSFWCYPFVI